MRRLAATSLLAVAGCNAHQSALAPFGEEADDTLTLTIVLAIGALILASGVAVLAWRAARSPKGAISHEGGMKLVLWLGAVGPAVILTVLLLFALPAMRPMSAAPGDLRIRVEGEQFWWRVRYDPAGEAPLTAANEIRVPVGRTVVFDLTATDVIHSFWIPGLAGKMDMIPGRTNRLVVRARKAGIYRGVCTEFCGLSHALMAFDVIAMEPAAFDAWLADARRASDGNEADAGGAAAFAAHGCGACHAIRGTAHDARIGPDLSRFGERRTLGAGILQPTIENTAAFIRDPHRFKPGARMPAYKSMAPADAEAIARYLKGLP
ncbi:cytochrome c oxidase subunit II [Novosphingobium sp. PC22D]|uniref:cytochrome c oxidase subunit II n=1 Tax=Novosphingobium sp. PC22D TaxID=1962403 RepID=UPI000BF213B7|nr:cytochrome c oxidase subunit II [Novosphingobium sp. PC22D]PEQ11442.1 cytochrome c oxidase subunit II [Novosphingobium sp. PC22D]